ncbi:MAG TPA: riboflavin synthase [Candidatus Eisenbacteria bacterium]|nr:riboflavin synthase [Candidatus Eisenbacteria bacterium]
MFSGIVARVGTVERVERGAKGLRLLVRAGLAPAPELGASVAVNGVCLTVDRLDGDRLEFVAVPETVSRTTLGALEAGSRVNLERALRVGDELGGHWVQGHVDGVGTVTTVERAGQDVRVTIEAPEAVRRFLAEKGSVSVDGMSLTVAAWRSPAFTVALIPYTLEHTIASDYRAGTRVNLEADLIARYLEGLIAMAPGGFR